MTLVASASTAAAATYTVNSNGDGADASLNGVCDDGGGHCTLRAAVAESNNSTSVDDSIGVDTSVFTGAGAGSVISPGSALPSITDTVTIDGGDCGGVSSDTKPCASIRGTGTSGISGLTVVAAATGSTIKSLDFANLNAAVLIGAGGVTVQGSWFGIALDESPTSSANAYGVLIGAPSGMLIGGTTAKQRNLFAQDTTAGVSIQGGDSNTVKGNYFGATRAGAFDGSLVNGDGIQVGGLTTPNAATGNVIGGPDTNSNHACDGACNLIANVADDGIELSGAGFAGGTPADSTTIQGNYVGLELDGTVGNSAPGSSDHQGIEFGSSPTASNTTVGGSQVADRNYIGGSTVGVDTGQVADSATIASNYFGVQPDGSGGAPNTFRGIGASGTMSGSVTVTDNVVGGSNSLGEAGIDVYGRNVTLTGNIVGTDAQGGARPFGGPAVVLDSSAAQTQIGGALPGDGNVIGNGNGAGLRIETGIDTVVEGNSIGVDSSGAVPSPNTGPGVLVFGGLRATIGGDAPDAQNLISNNTGDAIRVHQQRGVTILGNTGSGNGEQFIDLEDPAGPGNDLTTGSAGGLQPPVITTFNSAASTAGTAQPGAVVRVFAKSSASSGELASLLGAVTADGSGNWSLTFPSAQPQGKRLTATQTVPGPSASHETSELSAIVTVDSVAPHTTIDSAPPAFTNDATPTLSFHTDDAGATLSCKVDSGSFATCASPKAFGPFADGAHTIAIRGVDTVGNVEGSPPNATFTVDTAAPVARFTSGPKARVRTKKRSVKVRFGFAATGATQFQCALDRRAFTPCSSPKAVRLRRGRHIFKVRPRDAAGNVGTAIQRKVKVVKKRRHRKP